MSRSLLYEWKHDIAKYSINVGEMMKVAKDIYDTAYARGKAKAQEKTGHWIYKLEDWNRWTCSECGFSKRTDVHVKLGFKFCPNCGAKMLESEDG